MMRFFKTQISKDDYKVEKKEIGIGAYGTVNKATYQGKDVAVKVMPYNANTLQYCEKEVKALEYLTEANAPNVVKYYGCDYDGKDTISIVMEYMSKGDLSEYIENERHTPLSWQQRYNIMCQITSALAFIHSKGYVYSDMKGSNILLDENFNAKVCDFNLTHETKEKMRSGTIAYGAPEILIDGDDSSFSTDVFSLAMTFWEIAAWCKPHRHVPDANVVAMLEKTPPYNRLMLPERCPPNIAKLISWGWTDDPKARPSAQKILDELQSEETRKQVSMMSI